MPTRSNEDRHVDLATAEMDILRKELQGLKECQIKLLSTAPVATGFLIGLPQMVAKGSDVDLPLHLCALLPLLVLLPAWWTFFDKARTITRIVGYYRVLEATVRGDFNPKWFPGWERALEVFRRLRKPGNNVNPLKPVFEKYPCIWNELTRDEEVALCAFRPSPPNAKALSLPDRWVNRGRRIVKVLLLHERQRYWLIAYSMFFWLSVLVVGLSAYLLQSSHNCSSVQWWVIGVTAGIVLYTAFMNAGSLSALMWGENSYLANQLTWLWLLNDSDRPQEPAHLYR